MSPETKERTTVQVVALLLWLLTSVLSVLAMLAARDIVLRNYLRFVPSHANPTQGAYSLLNIVTMVPLAVLVIGIIIGGAEYHRVRVNTPDSWRMFARTLAVETAFLLMALFI